MKIIATYIIQRMKQLIRFLLFKLLCLVYHIWTTAENIINGFIRYVYLPLLHPNLNSNKIIKDLTNLEKKPSDQVTLIFEIKINKPSQIKRTVAQVAHYSKIVEQSINPTLLNCYLDTTLLKRQEAKELKNMLKNIVETENRKLNVLVSSDFNYREAISSEKKKITPLVVVFSSYPSVLGIHPSYLVGAEIAFRPQLFKSTDYDLYTSLERYATSEQRKGK